MSNPKSTPSLARAVGPEDLERGQYVAVLFEVTQWIPMFCTDDAAYRPVKLQEVELRPCGDNDPVRIEAVCIPFILVRDAIDRAHVLDVRNYRFAILDASFARRAMKRLRRSCPSSGPNPGKKRKKRKRKGK